MFRSSTQRTLLPALLLLGASILWAETAFGQELPGGFDVDVDLVSGPYHVGKITFSGHSRTRESVLRRMLGFYEGDLFDLSRVRAGIARLQSVVEIESEESIVMTPDPLSRRVDLDIRVEERDVFYPEGGAGYSQVDGWSGHMSLRARNSLGFGETFGVSFREGRLQQSLQAGASAPGLFGGLFDASFELYDDDVEYDFPEASANRSRRGFRLQIGRRLGPHSRAFARYHSSAIEDRSGDTTFEPFGASFVESAVMIGTSWDSHDDGFDPRHGRRMLLGLEASGGVLGGDVSALVPTFDVTTTDTLQEGAGFSTLLRTHLSASYIEPLSTTASGAPSISPLDRFFLGGQGSIRGFGYRSIWLRDENGASIRDSTGQIRGGDGSATLSLELHLVPRGPLRLVAFADAGQLFADGVNESLFGARASAGLELQLRLPKLQVPLRLIWAENLTPLPQGPVPVAEERFEHLSLGIGLSF